MADNETASKYSGFPDFKRMVDSGEIRPEDKIVVDGIVYTFSGVEEVHGSSTYRLAGDFCRSNAKNRLKGKRWHLMPD